MKKKLFKWVALIVVSLLLTFTIGFTVVIAAVSAVSGEANERQVVTGSLSEETLFWQGSVEAIGERIGFDPQYNMVVLAIIEYESGGVGGDIMGASLTPYNTRFPQQPDAILAPAYSIECGMNYLKDMMNIAGVKGITDEENLLIAIQSYNYGEDYVSFAKFNKGHSKASSEKYYEQNGFENDISKIITYADSVWAFIPNGDNPLGTDTGGFIYPYWGSVYISAGFGYYDPFDNGSIRMHNGIDFPRPYGDRVRASKGGVVIYAQWSDSYGYFVEIDHGNNMTTLYGHNSSLNVSVGQKVQQGEVIAFVGSTGISSGAHIHLEISINGTRVDPEPYLPKTNTWGG